MPVDRFYIERFLACHAEDIRGRVLEVSNNTYTMKFGGARVTKSDVLHNVANNQRATIVADLGTGGGVPEAIFDCIVCTQTLQFIFSVQDAVTSLHRMLKPSGVLLVTVPGISQISREDMVETGDYWRFTAASVGRLLEARFDSCVTVESAGNVYAATALLQGIAVAELDACALDYADPQYQMLITARAVKEG
jgi:SAM-dependent methyltransferase